MRLIFIAQCLIPAGVLVALLLAPARSWLASATLLGTAMLVLAALARVGLWLFPPWWTPWACALVGLLVWAWRLAQQAPRTGLPSGILALSTTGAMVVVAAGALVVLVRAADAASPPPGEIVDLEIPFASGRYLVVNGGSWEVMNAHRESARSPDPRFLPWRGNGWAVDFVEVDALGRRAFGVLPPDPDAYRIYRRKLTAPCTGQVVIVMDGLPDMPIPEYDRTNLAGNHIVMACGGVHVVMAHLRRGSVRVRGGDDVEVGQPLAEVGNSGGTGEPHLHLHVQRPGPPGLPLGGDPVPARIGGRFLVRGDRLEAPRTGGGS